MSTTHNIIGRVANISMTKAEWLAATTALQSGEIGYESDTGNWKIGDGTHLWADLEYRGVKEITVDTALADSENPVQNKVVKAKFDEVSSTISGYDKSIAELKTSISTVETSIGTINTEIDTINDEIVDLNKKINTIIPPVYGFKINPSESDPSSAVTYLEDAVGMTPAKMNYTSGEFEYGSWENAFFMPRPCMLKYDGTVDYYLDPTDYTKKKDGTSSDVANTSYAGNAMMEWGKDGKRIWYKIEPSSTAGGADVYISNKQVDDTYHCWSFYDCNGTLQSHFYTAIYNGSLIDSKLRSLSGQTPSVYTTQENEATYAKANNTGSDTRWYTETYADWVLINLLLILISKSLDSQTAFGYGYANGNSSAISTGTGNTKGLFWGESTGKYLVKVFGMENSWGNILRRIAGWTINSGKSTVKLTWGTQDGSTTTGYNTSGSASGYISSGVTLTSSGCINTQYFSDVGFFTPRAVSGSTSTYYCDYAYCSSNTGYAAQVGGRWNNGSDAGAFRVNLSYSASHSYSNIGASPSYR